MREESIYIVDDDAWTGQLVNAALREAGFRKNKRFTGYHDFFDKYDPQNPPELIISDYRLQPTALYNGVDLLNRANSMVYLAEPPITLIMSETQVPSWGGAFFEKPYDKDVFMRDIRDCVLKLLQVSYLR